jgi:N-acetylneuraminic acid mutarotase
MIKSACGWQNIGVNDWITKRTTMEYDPEENSWQEKTGSPEAMGGNASCVLNDTICILGGYSYSNSSLEKKAWYYAPGTDTWYSLPDMIYDRGIGSTADTLDNKLYVIGGIDDFVNLHGKSEVYDPELKIWTVLSDMPVPVINHISVVHDQKILVFGGDSSWTGGCQWGCSVGTNFIQE